MNRMAEVLSKNPIHENLMDLLEHHLYDLTGEEVVCFLQRKVFWDTSRLVKNLKKEYRQQYFDYIVPIIEKHEKALDFVNTNRNLAKEYAERLDYLGLGLSMRLQKELLTRKILFYAIIKKHFLSEEFVKILESKVEYQPRLLEYRVFGRRIKLMNK